MTSPLLLALLSAGLAIQSAPSTSAPAQTPQTPQIEGVRNYTKVDATIGCAGATDSLALARIAGHGYKAVLNLREATEASVNIDESRAAAEAAGLKYVHLPFKGLAPDPKVADEFLKVVGDVANQPLFIHCGSANRVSALWLIKRMVVDTWTEERAVAEAKMIGLTSDALQKFALEYAAARKVEAKASGASAQAQAQPQPAYPDARASDPVTLGWMVGTPAPADRIITFDDLSYYRFPQLRWSFSHWRELTPTTNVSRGPRPVYAFPQALRSDLDAVTFTPLGSAQTMTWEQSLDANYTDGIVVLHQGRIVYERYQGALKPEGQHIAFSVTKSFFGTIGAILVDEGKLDEAALVSRYLPELKDSAFGDATVRQVMDMTTGMKFSEKYADPSAEVWGFARASGQFPSPPGYQGPRSLYAYLKTIVKEGEHGKGFTYRSPNAEVLTWLIRRVTGKSAAQNLQERIWEKLGAEQDAYIHVDSQGNAVGAGGLNLGLRDLARFGEAMRQGGSLGGQQIVPARVVGGIRRGADREQFKNGGYSTLPGWSYRHQWWISHDDHGAFAARGVHGQTIYVDPKAEMVIARFASHPVAGNLAIDPTSLPAYRALADHLLAKPR